MSEIILDDGSQVRATEVMDLRAGAGQAPGLIWEWEDSVDRALYIVTARELTQRQGLSSSATQAEQARLVGVGFVAGNLRQAMLCDVSVHREYRQQGIGAQVCRAMLDFTTNAGIAHVSANFDDETPLSRDWLEAVGFRWSAVSMDYQPISPKIIQPKV